MPKADSKTTPPPSSLDPRDILYALFRHKGLILLGGLLGLAAATTFSLLAPRNYESRAKLFVRYVLDRSAIDPVNAQRETSGRGGATVMDSEVQILTSWDLATRVAERLGDASPIDSAVNLLANLEVIAPRDSNVITLAYTDSDPARAQATLDALVRAYFDRHLEIHRSVGAFAFVSQQADRMRGRLETTEATLRDLKSRAGIVTIGGSKDALAARLAATEQELLATDALIAEQKARVQEIERADATEANGSSDQPARPADSATIQRYRAWSARLVEARKTEFDLLARYTPDNRMVRQASARIADVERQIRQMERDTPALGSLGLTSAASAISLGRPDIVAERASLVAAQARAAALREQMTAQGAQVGELTTLGGRIDELERRREVEETNSKYFESSLERARVDEALDPSKIPNISIVQAPSPAFRLVEKPRKIALALAGGGWAGGFALALALGLLLDRSIKRPLEIETRLGLPTAVIIPRLRRPRGPKTPLAPWEPAHFMRPYGEALGNRLIHAFEVEQMTHKPKLIGVTSCAPGAGVSTIACSLAAALSGTGDGKVLLVNVHPRNAAFHRFADGRPAASLSDALAGGGTPALKAPDTENLYLASAVPEPGESSPSLSKTLHQMIPRFRASEFDYVIFDLPPVGQMSPTQMIAGFLDKVVLVIEAEKNDRDIVRRAARDLAAAKGHVLGLLNQARSRVPTWIEAPA